MKESFEPIETLFMKNSVYVDTSILLPVYVPEPLQYSNMISLYYIDDIRR